MSTAQLNVTNATLDVCSVSLEQRNAERQARFRKTPVGIVLAALRNEDLKQARLRRRLYHASRKHQACSLSFDGRYSGPLTSGVPALGDLRLSSFKEVQHG
jgi:hypothetical protein